MLQNYILYLLFQFINGIIKLSQNKTFKFQGARKDAKNTKKIYKLFNY